MTLLFHELRFYLTRTLSTTEKTELQACIIEHGGLVSVTPAGAMQLVNNETLDARHPEWISIDFIKDSVALQVLQNPFDYSGQIFTIGKGQTGATQSQGRRKYTVEDDARMLHFAKLRGWKSMQPVAESTWKKAESERVTLHSAPSMHEHFRKQLQRKTLMEQRNIMAKAAAVTRTWMLATEEEEKTDKSDSTGERHVEKTTSRRTLLSTGHTSRATPFKASSDETREEEKSRPRDVRTRSRKPTSPLRILQRLQKSEETEVSGGITSSAAAVNPKIASPAMLVAPAAPEIPGVQGSETGNQRVGGKQEKRKHGTSSSGATVSHDLSLSRQETADSDADSSESKTSRDNGVFFRSTWTELTRDPAKRRMLQRFFEPASVPAPKIQASSIGSAVTHPTDVVVSTAAQVGGSQQVQTVEVATEEDTDQIICDLQINTWQDMPTVVHALYYCSGDAEIAKIFLKGAVPSSMWSPDDDLLLVNLLAEESIDRLAVDAAMARGDFTSMRVPRDTDAILKRIQFLR